MKYSKRITACLLSAFFLVGLLPAARAANEAAVIKSLYLRDTANGLSTTTVEPGSSRNITLYVPYTYSDSTSFDLYDDLVYEADLTSYKSVVVTPAAAAISLSSEAAASYIKLAVTYNVSSDSDTAAKSETDYYIRVVKTAQVASTFSGVIKLEAALGGAAPALSTAISGNYVKNEGNALGYITVDGSNSDAGTLSFPGGLSFGSEIPVGSLSGLSFTPSASGVVSYSVTAYDSGNTKVGTAVLTITVYAKPVINSAISASVYVGSTKTFTKSDFTSSCGLNNSALEEIEITIDSTAAGTWYLDGSALSAGLKTIAASSIGSLSFSGTAAGTATFSWNVKNAAGYADSGGAGTITVTAASLTLSSYSSASGISRGGTLMLSSSSFAYSPSTATLSFLKLATVPNAADGYLCLTTALAKNTALGYAAITASTALKAGAVIPYSYLKYLELVSKSGGTGTNLSFTWSATTSAAVTNATWANAASYTVYFKTGGAVSYTTPENVPVELAASDFSSAFLSSTGYTLSYITFTLPSSKAGKLLYNYSASTKTGTAVTAKTKYYCASSPNISSICFVPYADFTGAVSVAYSGYSADGSCVDGTLSITVSEYKGGTVSYTIDKNSSVQLDASDFSKVFKDSTGSALSYVRFTLPSSSYGKLYYNYNSASDYDSTVSASSRYYVNSSQYLSYVSFVAAEDYTGTVVISYTAYDKNGNAYQGKLIVFIIDSAAGIVAYSVRENGTLRLSGDDFYDEFIDVTGSVLSYILITPPDKITGMLFSNYSTDTKTGTKVTASTKYYNGASPDISDISFIPASNFTGVVIIKYTVYTEAGKAYAGKLKIKVGESGSGSVSLSTAINTAVKLNSTDLNSAFYESSGGSALSYITFTLPSSSYGKLYYGYTSSAKPGTAVTADTKYYAGSAPYISNISFVPRTGYAGNFAISYTGYASGGTACAGKIQLTVGGGDGTIYYETAPNTALTLSASDFYSACDNELDGTLSYVKFSLPSSVCGKLYYEYASASSYSAVVSSSSKYYYSSSPLISEVSFVPYTDYTGSCSFDYTGYDTEGDKFEGTIIISVVAESGGELSYTTDNETPVSFDSSDFNTAFLRATGTSLYSVKFTLPPSTSGQLYYEYASPTSYSSKVTSTAKYYRTVSPLISDVTFVPNESYSGTVIIDYIAYSTTLKEYSGVLSITVTDADAYPFTDVGGNYSWASDAVLYLYKSGVILGSGDGVFDPGGSMTRGDFLLMVCRAFDFSSSNSENFSDVASDSYYYDAIAACKELGIAKGNSGKFYPNEPISRQDAMVLIIRAMAVGGNSPESGSAGELTGYSDDGEVSGYAVDSVAALVKAGFVKGSGGQLKPKSMISRAETAVILYKVLSA